MQTAVNQKADALSQESMFFSIHFMINPRTQCSAGVWQDVNERFKKLEVLHCQGREFLYTIAWPPSCRCLYYSKVQCMSSFGSFGMYHQHQPMNDKF